MIKKYGLILIFLATLLILSSCSVAKAELPESSPETTGQSQAILAPDFSLEDLDGHVVTLSDLIGKPVIINFWTTWCPYCVDEMPDLQRLYEKYEQDGLMVLAINVQESNDKISKFLEEENIKLPILLDKNGSVAAVYGANSIPLTLAINDKGEVVTGSRGKLSYEQMEAMVDALLNNQP
ncbi:MAG: TlpA family protein disulfide reductase [Tissierellales bacterium]|nr:TlpA family protein disulfide reductase [Tissierellales bacterium]MBN2827620.1 TlpA family protein disulfide reductase [Tissierellales bacterium]